MRDLEDIFGADGPLAQALPGYRPRDSQQRMAAQVAATLGARGRLLVEAGTGTGKTFAYLIPALLSGGKVIVSTGTRTLQDQLFARDVPLLARVLGRIARIALLKGRSNYLCRERLLRPQADLPLEGVGAGSLLDEHGVPEPADGLHGLGGRRDPRLTRSGLSGHSNAHGGSSRAAGGCPEPIGSPPGRRGRCDRHDPVPERTGGPDQPSACRKPLRWAAPSS